MRSLKKLAAREKKWLSRLPDCVPGRIAQVSKLASSAAWLTQARKILLRRAASAKVSARISARPPRGEKSLRAGLDSRGRSTRVPGRLAQLAKLATMPRASTDPPPLLRRSRPTAAC